MNHLQRLGPAVMVLGVLASGCGSDNDPEPTPEPTTSPDSSSASSTPTESESATESTVPPATGKLMRLPGASARAPEKWSIEKSDLTLSWEARHPEAFGSVFLSQRSAAATTLDDLLASIMDDFQGRPKVSMDAELGGEPAFRAVGKDSIGPFVEYGAVLDDRAVTLSFGIDEYLSAKERRRIEESVLATFEWR